jgi:fibronectin-binding autotransporter adhesin
LAPINFANDVTLAAGGVTLDSNGFDSTFSGAFTGTGAGGVTKINLGTVTLSGTSLYGGDTVVNGGTLNIQNGGKVSDTAGILGAAAGTTGIVNVIGPGSTWINSGGVGVGSSGTGTLNIRNGGTVSDNNGTLGASPGSTGTVTVDGAGSVWTNGANLSVGSAGTGTLNIQNGGQVTDTVGEIGLLQGSAGTVLVDGTNSTWTNSGGLRIGGLRTRPGGTGLLQITNGGTVNAAATTIWNTGTLAVGASFTLNTALLTVNGGTIRTLADTTFPNNATLAAGGVTLDSKQFNSTFSGAFSGAGAVTKIGSGSVTLSGANSYSGGTNLDGGILAVESDSNLGTGPLSFDGGTLEALAAGGGITSSKAVTLAAGGGAFLADPGTNSTLSGVIGGTGAFTKDGAGTLTLSGENTYSGGTTISAGTLQLGNGGTTGSIVGDVLDKGTLVFNRSGGKKTFAGVISGSGSLVKLGSDILELTQDNTYSGGTTIEDGVLVAGVPIAGQATSCALGTGNVFLNGGTLRAPSLDPLIINVGGDYTQGPGGTLALGIGGLDGSQYDHAQVGGNASLNGTLAVSSLNNFRPVSGNAFEVVHSNGTRTGQFAQVNDFLNNNPNLQRFDIYASNAVVLLYAAATTPAPTPTPTPPTPVPTPTPPGPTPSPTPNPRPPIDIIVPQPLPPVDPGEPIPPKFLLSFLDPTVEQLTSMFEIPFSGANTQRFNLTDRMTQIQRGSTGFVSAVPPTPAPIPTGKEIGKKEVVPPALVPGPTNRWGVWVNGWGEWVNVNDDNGAKGYNFTTGGVSVGVDYRITDYLAIGLFGTYAHTWTSLNPGSIDVNTGRGGLCATYWNQGFYINGAIYGGYNSYDTSRGELTNTLANGSTSGYEVSTFVDTGYDFHFGDLSFGPVFAAQYTNVHVDGFTEQGSFLPLNIHSDSEESWRTDLGVLASYSWHVGNIILIPSLWAAWEHEYKYSRLPITFSSVEFPGVSATAFGPHEGHDSAIINAGVGTQWTPRISTYVGYQGQLGRDNYDANGVTGTISFAF